MNTTVTPSIRKMFPDSYLHHIGIALPESEILSQTLSNFFPLDILPAKKVPAQGVRVIFLKAREECNIPEIEIITPLGKNSPIDNFLSKNPSGALHHLCFAVGNLETAIKKIHKNGHDIIAPPKVGAHGDLVVFVHPKTTKGLLIELCSA